MTLIATGTEVDLAMRACARLAGQGMRSAVVSLPCWHLFEAQTPAFQARALGPALRFGGDRWLRPEDRFTA